MTNIINDLKSSPLYYMSLGSMELFHSNFWFWLIKNNKEFIRAFFNENEISNECLKTIDKTKIKREYRHTDILIECNEGVFILENKIKTLANENQLMNYESNFKKTFKQGKYLIVHYNEELGLQLENWTPLLYKDVLDKIETISNDLKEIINYNDYIIINEYIKMTRSVISVIDKTVIDLKLNNTLLIDLKKEFINYLTDLRLDDIIRKINGSILFSLLKKELVNDYNESEYYYQCGYNHKSITISIRRKVIINKEKYIMIGPQLEANTFRRMIHITNKEFGINKNETDLSKIYNTLKKIYFNDEKFKYPTSKKKDKKKYNEYKGIYGDKKEQLDKVDYIAIYRYLKVDEEIKEKDICFEKIIKLFKEELEYVKKIDVNDLVMKIDNKEN